MAHNITDLDGAVFSREQAWHGLGLVIQEDMSPTEAMTVANLNWTVSKVGPVVAGGASSDDYNAIVRDDTSTILSIQSPDYKVIQNSEVFDMAYNLGNNIKVESALSLGGGKRLIVLCKTGTMDAASNLDTVEQYMAFINSHDGTLAHMALPTSVRIVCQNTLSMALASGTKKAFRIVHSGDTKLKQEAMANALKFYTKTGKLFEEQVHSLVHKELTKADIQKFWMQVWGMIEEPIEVNPTTEDAYANTLKATTEISKWANTFDEERKSLNSTPNLWLAANAVTKYLQHRAPARGRTPSFESQAYNNLLGKNQDTTIDVMKFALLSV